MNKYNWDYFSRYIQKNTFKKPRGKRAFFYNYWLKYLSKNFNDGARILEVGCGLGYFLEKLSSKYKVYAMDISWEALIYAKNNIREGLVFQADAEKIPLSEASIDCIIAFDVIEHLHSPESFLEQAKGMLKKDGFLIISTPNPESFGSMMKKKSSGFNEEPYANRMNDWHGWRDDTHINIRKIKQWRELIGNMGFYVTRDGTDFWWDTPYFPYIPLLFQKIVFNGTHRLLTYFFGFLSWKWGENYYVVAQN